MGGGILLLGVMAQFFPPAQLIPLHGLVQLGSNVTRCWLLKSFIDKKTAIFFAGGALIGALLGAVIPRKFDEFQQLSQVLIAVFIIFSIWIPKKISFIPKGHRKYIFLGVGSTFISILVGATGPLLAPFFLKDEYKKEILVATKAFCQLSVHTLKVALFGWIGFSFWAYSDTLVIMLVAVFLGNSVGKVLLGRVSQRYFVSIFRALLSLLAIRMLYMAFQ